MEYDTSAQKADSKQTDSKQVMVVTHSVLCHSLSKAKGGSLPLILKCEWPSG